MIVHKAFKTRIYPTEEQKIYFNKSFGITRFAYNWYLEKSKYYYEQNIKKSFYDLRKEFNSLRNNQFPFVLDVNNRIYSNVAENPRF